MADEKDEISFGPEVSPGVRVAMRRDVGGEHPILISKVKNGEPMGSDSEFIHVDKECRDGWHTVTGSYKTGPAQVATPEYREGWDRIFGKKPDVGLA